MQPPSESNASPEYLTTAAALNDPKRYTSSLEDRTLFENLAIDYHLRYAPVGPDENHLVDNLIFCEQQKRLLLAILTQIREILFSQTTSDQPTALGAAYLADLTGPDTLGKTERKIAALDQTWFRSHRTLERLQKQRLSQQPTASPLPASEAGLTALTPNPQPPTPAEQREAVPGQLQAPPSEASHTTSTPSPQPPSQAAVETVTNLTP